MREIPTKAYARRIFPNITDGYTHTPDYYQPVYDVPINQGTVSRHRTPLSAVVMCGWVLTQRARGRATRASWTRTRWPSRSRRR